MLEKFEKKTKNFRHSTTLMMAITLQFKKDIPDLVNMQVNTHKMRSHF